MQELKYKVYALLDHDNCIIGIESTAFHNENELIEKGYKLIDEGTGNVYGHAQGNYLPYKYGKNTLDKNVIPNFIFENGVIRALSDDEKASFFSPQKPQPSELDLLKERQERTEEALQDLILMTLGVNNHGGVFSVSNY